MKHLIIGNGAAGTMAAAKIRELNDSDEITIISNEDTTAYSKCMLPDYIGGRMKREKLFIRDINFYNINKIKLLSGVGVKQIDTISKSVVLENGHTEMYDRLLLAAGAVPFVPPIEGLDKVEYLKVSSLSEADYVREKAISGGKALVIGAGLTGIEVGFALKHLGMKVCIIEKSQNLLPRQLDPYSSGVFIEELRKEGINLITNRGVNKVETEGSKKWVELDTKVNVEFDLLVVAIGTRSNVGIIKDMPIKCERGIVVDEYLRTSVENVFAAGDIAQEINSVSGENVSCYTWANAMAQGRRVAYSMTGRVNEILDTGIQNSVQLRDIPFVSMGVVNPPRDGYEILVNHDRENSIYKRLILKDNVIKGMIMIGDTSTMNVLSGLVRKGTDVTAFKGRLLEKGFKV